MDIHVDVGPSGTGSLKHASWDRLACLLRHWTWANEAMATFDRELANGLDDEDDPMSDHPFGAFYHWCALLCGLGEAALEHGLLSPFQLEPIRQDLEAGPPLLVARLRMHAPCIKRARILAMTLSPARGSSPGAIPTSNRFDSCRLV
jgi:hypothetical protein